MSYAIGVAQPLSVHVDTYGTGTIPDKQILAKVLKKFDFRPGAPCWLGRLRPDRCLECRAWCRWLDSALELCRELSALAWHGICRCAHEGTQG